MKGQLFLDQNSAHDGHGRSLRVRHTGPPVALVAAALPRGAARPTAWRGLKAQLSRLQNTMAAEHEGLSISLGPSGARRTSRDCANEIVCVVISRSLFITSFNHQPT